MPQVFAISLWTPIRIVPYGNSCRKHSEEGSYIRAPQAPNGSQAGVSSIMLLRLASVRGRRVAQDVQHTLWLTETSESHCSFGADARALGSFPS